MRKLRVRDIFKVDVKFKVINHWKTHADGWRNEFPFTPKSIHWIKFKSMMFPGYRLFIFDIRLLNFSLEIKIIG